MHLVAEEAPSSSSDLDEPTPSGWARARRALALASLTAALVLAATSLTHRRERSQWSGAADLTQDFDFHVDFGLKHSLQRFEEKMKGLTGTCSSGPQCANNVAAVRRTCDKFGSCKDLPVAYCCSDPKSTLRTELHNGEVTCTCDTTSKTLQKFEKRVEEFKEDGSLVLNKLRAATGQCLKGQEACMSQTKTAIIEGELHCCRLGQELSTAKAGLSSMCRCT